eukprot:gene12502-12637_t
MAATLQSDAFKRLYSEEYFQGHINEGFRPDGRVLGVCRPVTVGLDVVTSADGSAIVKVGASTVLAGVRLEVMVPSSEAPADGQLVVSVEMTALSSPNYRPGRAPSITYVIQQRVTDILIGCGVLKLSDLCIGEGQAVWVVYLDLYILNAAGSLLDAALLAAVAALQGTKLPAVHLTEEGNVERDVQQAADGTFDSSSGGDGSSSRADASWVPLQLHDTPLCLTCGVYKDQLIADPDHEEEALMAATISVVLGTRKELLGLRGRACTAAHVPSAYAFTMHHHQLWYHVPYKLLAACMAMLVLAQLSAAQLPLVCVVIRTYFAHGTYGNSALMNLLHSLKKQEHTRWVAMLLVMDNRPFPDLRHIVRDGADERIQVFAEWISAHYQPKTADGRSWSNDYHSKLYNLTDEAIRACPKSTSWLMVTNGDNDYDPQFMTAIVQQPVGTEVVAFDYYSRFQRSTGLPCERFAAGPGVPTCKENLLRWCQTDLAANVYWWPRFVADDMLFGVLDSGRGANHDGFMAEVVVKRSWKVAHVPGRCLVEHSPSPQLCASLGGVWDDSFAGSDEEAGGKCLEASRYSWLNRLKV